MVLSKMYSGEHIVIPDKISNLLKTYAKGELIGVIVSRGQSPA